MRLAICVLLTNADEIKFAAFKQALGGTDGSLGAQLRKLEDNRYVTVRKTFEGRRPVSWYQITQMGKRALRDHLAALSVLVDVGQSD